MRSFWLAKSSSGSAGYRKRFCGRVVIVLLLLALAPFATASDPEKLAEAAFGDITKALPKQLGTFRQVGSIRSVDPSNVPSGYSSNAHLLDVQVEYVSTDGARLEVELIKFPQDADAYSFLTLTSRRDQPVAQLGKEVGTASVAVPTSVNFFKGRMFVRVSEAGAQHTNTNKPLELARLISERMESGEGDVPVLVKHLPRWEEAQQRVAYFARFKSLKDALPNQPILETVNSAGDADAVASTYGSAHLLIVEFNTPQLAADNDRAIIAKSQELKNQGQPAPSAYRRVGNYSVFVFNAADEKTAGALIEEVKYEQVVQWLGDNPNLLEQAQRDYYQTTAGVLVAVVKASGLSLLACLVIGALFGGLLFSYRRAQQRTTEAYSDAGGMLRLNIDEMTAKSDPQRLLGPGR